MNRISQILSRIQRVLWITIPMLNLRTSFPRVPYLRLCGFASDTKHSFHQWAYIYRAFLRDIIMVNFASNLSNLFLHFFKCFVHIELKFPFPDDSYTKAISFGFPKSILESWGVLTRGRKRILTSKELRNEEPKITKSICYTYTLQRKKREL